MKIRFVMFVLMALTVLVARPAVAADMTCAQWLAYRTGDTSVKGLDLLLTAYLQGYIDGANDFGDTFNGYLVSEVSPGKFAPTPPSPRITLENTLAVLVRKCTENRGQSAHVVAITEVHSEVLRRASPILESMTTVFHRLNDAKGYK
jgi:hypothetical protein